MASTPEDEEGRQQLKCLNYSRSGSKSSEDRTNKSICNRSDNKCNQSLLGSSSRTTTTPSSTESRKWASTPLGCHRPEQSSHSIRNLRDINAIKSLILNKCILISYHQHLCCCLSLAGYSSCATCHHSFFTQFKTAKTCNLNHLATERLLFSTLLPVMLSYLRTTCFSRLPTLKRRPVSIPCFHEHSNHTRQVTQPSFIPPSFFSTYHSYSTD